MRFLGSVVIVAMSACDFVICFMLDKPWLRVLATVLLWGLGIAIYVAVSRPKPEAVKQPYNVVSSNGWLIDLAGQILTVCFWVSAIALAGVVFRGH